MAPDPVDDAAATKGETMKDEEIVRRLADGEDPWVIDPEYGCTNPMTGYFPSAEVAAEKARRMSDLDSAAVEAKPYRSHLENEVERLTAELAEARASLERVRGYLADRTRTCEVLTRRAETAEGERTMLEGLVEGLQPALDEAVARAENAEADRAVCREALEKIARLSNGELIHDPTLANLFAHEALSRLSHSSEEER